MIIVGGWQSGVCLMIYENIFNQYNKSNLSLSRKILGYSKAQNIGPALTHCHLY